MDNAAEKRFQAELSNSLILEVIGQDAAKVMNNLCTNDISKLAVGECCEAFVTDLRGRVVAHGTLAKLSDRVLLVGRHSHPEKVCNHVDRYIITEDAQVNDQSAAQRVLVVDDLALAVGKGEASDSVDQAPRLEAQVADATLTALPSSIVGPRSGWLVVDGQQADQVQQALSERGFSPIAGSDFELARIRAFWPFEGSEILDKTIPQELDRDRVAISFTKGCYLGQETIARLDARGQLQKKLCLLELASMETAAGDVVFNGDKEVGKLSSVAVEPHLGQSVGLAMLRRGSFDSGTQLTCRAAAAVVVSAKLEQP